MRTSITIAVILPLIWLMNCTSLHGQALIVPDNFPKYKVVANNSPAEGYFFTVPTVTNLGPGYLTIMDNYGTPVYYRYFGTFIGSLSRQPNGMLSFRHRNPTVLHHFLMDSSYKIVDTIETVNYKLDAHDIVALKNGHYLIFGTETRIVDMSTVVPGGKPAASVIECVIQELDENEQVVFEWKTTDNFKITDSYYDLTASSIDYVHPNTLELDNDGNILLQSRFMDELTKINRQTGEIMWRMGGKNNQFTFTDTASRFSWAHDARRLPNGNITMFDNGFMRDEKYSRAVEYEVDEVNKVMNLVWSYDGGKKVFSPTTGSTRRLDNGNTVIGYGFDVSKPAIVEVNPDGSIAFKLDFPPKAGSYRSLKFPWRTNFFEPITYSVDFGEWDGYTVSSYLLPVKNNSDQVVTLTGYSTRTEAFTIEESFPIDIPAKGNVILTINYYPETIETGLIKDVLTINSDINSDTLVQRIAQQVTLSGKKADGTAPVASFPLANMLNVALDTVIYINLSEPVRNPDNSEFTYLNVDPVVVLKKENADGEDVPFDAVINTDKNLITITPKSQLAHTSTYYVAITNAYEDFSNNSGTAASATFTTIDLTAPVATITPENEAKDILPSAPVIIQFDEPVRNSDNSELSDSNLASLITLKTINENGTDVPFAATINAAKTIITIVPDHLTTQTIYYVAIGTMVEDYNNNPSALASSTFTTGSVTGLAENQQNVLKVYPNPGNGLFTLDLSGQVKKRIKVTDLNGRTIYRKKNISANSFQLDLRNYQDGSFILYIEDTDSGAIQTFKLIKQNAGK